MDTPTQEKNRLSTILLLAALIGLMIIAVVMTRTEAGDQAERTTATATFARDVAMLWAQAEQVYAQGNAGTTWNVRWDAQVALDAAGELAALLGVPLQETASEMSADGRIYSAMRTLDTYAMQLWYADQGDLVLLLQATPGITLEELLSGIDTSLAALQAIQADYMASFNVRGAAREVTSAQRLLAALATEERETYDDGHTRSNTYYTAALAEYHTQDYNLQLAEYAGKLIIGVPLISGDYYTE